MPPEQLIDGFSSKEKNDRMLYKIEEFKNCYKQGKKVF